MKNSHQLSHQLFMECDWKYVVAKEDHFGYSSIMRSLQASAKEMMEAGKQDCFKVLELLARATSMHLIADSLNEPFKPLSQDFHRGLRSSIPEDFSLEELSFFEEILNDVNEPYLRARLADLLWLVEKPRNPDHARIAIDAYITNVIGDKLWHRGTKECLERAARLSIQINDFDRLENIKQKLYAAFWQEYPDMKFMTLWVASLMDKLKIDKDYAEEIASSLYNKANNLKAQDDFDAARSYFELAAKKYKQYSNKTSYIESLCAIAECFELEANARTDKSNLVANSLYENAIQAYREIPAKYRDAYNIEEKILGLRTKITVSGQASLNEMQVFKSESIDISEMVKGSIDHVAGKRSPQDALVYFIGLSNGAEYKELAKSAKDTFGKNLLSTLFTSSHMSSDGRVIARTPPINRNADADDPVNKAAFNSKIQELFSMQVQLIVKAQILPALSQLCMEHRFTKELMIAICKQSPMVPKNRVNLLGNALWLGFEGQFDLAIHLLCPQVEHIVRLQLKEAGAQTSNFNRDGIENENGLSTLMELAEAIEVFGENLSFEIKSIFTEVLGFNLRNQVAHGLLDDNSSISIASIYAWWMTLRLVIRSIILRDNENE